ncbi:MAG: cupin domain-containing protein, partial [Acidobacteriota bacterium]
MHDLDVLLQSQRLPVAMFEVFRKGVSFPVEDWSVLAGPDHRRERFASTERLLDLYKDGATLVVNGVHRCLPRLGALCRQLTRELEFPVQGNVYITPPGAQGFSRHSDDHDVLVLQIHGNKTWRLIPEPDRIISIELNEGDFLYIPRGLAHEAESTHAASIHLTLGLKPVYLFQLVEELAAVAREHPEFQKPVHFGSAESGRERTTELEPANFSRFVQSLLQETPPATLMARRRSAMVRTQDAGWENRLSDVLQVPRLGPGSFVGARPDLAACVLEDGKNVKVEFAGNSVVVPLFLRSVVDQLLGEEAVQ